MKDLSMRSANAAQPRAGEAPPSSINARTALLRGAVLWLVNTVFCRERRDPRVLRHYSATSIATGGSDRNLDGFHFGSEVERPARLTGSRCVYGLE